MIEPMGSGAPQSHCLDAHLFVIDRVSLLIGGNRYLGIELPFPEIITLAQLAQLMALSFLVCMNPPERGQSELLIDTWDRILVSRKFNRRDADLILKLLMENRFPAIWLPSLWPCVYRVGMTSVIVGA